ncbi:IS5 family transposase [Candidatus Paracaedibacter symbiosus]|uniref:IS5 family transposase n=1 Tax=Candidatus Paracaedibacter symbiosus TaxID=244582 RepID=UPI00068A919A
MYPSDLTDKEWDLIKDYFKPKDPRGCKPKYNKRLIVNTIFYLNKGGIQWRMLPKDYPPWKTVYDYFRT